jgi:outer membrane protein OmpA-like peptidoglycan-associated protein
VALVWELFTVCVSRSPSDPRLAGQITIIHGYTDCNGNAEYNRRLWQLRTDSIRDVHVREFNIETGRLITKGYGMSKFRNATDPLANENGRVQVTNWKNKLALSRARRDSRTDTEMS